MAEETNNNNTNNESGTGKKPKVKKKRTLLQKIVNVFLYIVIGILVLLLVVIGITQTGTFRNFLREKVIEIANGELNGELNIGKIEGTIFTSLTLRNTSITMEGDTLLSAGDIIVKTSPLDLLRKRIFIRKFEIRNADINLVEDSTGTLNIARLVPPSPDTTASSPFPFTIEAADVKLTNVDVSLQSYNNVGSSRTYAGLDMSDFRINNLNMGLGAVADLDDNEYELELKYFRLNTNINGVALKDMSGEFAINPEGIYVNDFLLETERSNLELNTEITGFNVFDTTGTSDFMASLIKANLRSDNFNFADLSAFMPSMNMIQGSIAVNADVEGTMKEMDLNTLAVAFMNTHMEAEGVLRNLDDPDRMYISARFKDTHIQQEDLDNMMPELGIPVYQDYGILRFQTLTFEGNPLDFKTNIVLHTDGGNLTAEAALNFRNTERMVYDLNFSTENLNLGPFTGMVTQLNSNGSVKGSGTKPEAMNAVVRFTGDGTVIEGLRMDTLRFNTTAENARIEYDLLASQDTTKANLEGYFDFTNADSPVYELAGELRNLNPLTFGMDSTFRGNLNFTLDAMGENLNPDEMDLFVQLMVVESTIKGVAIDSNRAIVDIRSPDETGSRVINIISDLADITITGSYSVTQAISLAGSEVKLLSNAIQNKLNEIMPAGSGFDNQLETGVARQEEEAEGPEDVPKQETETAMYVPHPDSLINMEYHVELKDFEILTIFLGENQLEIDGEINGALSNTMDSVYFTISTQMNYLKYWSPESALFISNFAAELDLSNDYNSRSMRDISAELDLTTARIFDGADINDIDFRLRLAQNRAALSLSAGYENMAGINFDGVIDVNTSSIALLIDTLDIVYNNFRTANTRQAEIIYGGDRIEINNFTLARNQGLFSIDGYLAKGGNQDLTIKLDNFDVNDISTTLLAMRPENALAAKLNMNTHITGSFAAPVIDVDMGVDSVTYKNRNFGNLVTQLDYNNRNLGVDIRFLDTLLNAENAALKITGNLPIDLALEGVEQRLPEGEPVKLSLHADNFNLGAFGDLLPMVNRLRGILNMELGVNGTYEALRPAGSLELVNGGFVAEMNNLEYNMGLKLDVTEELVTLERLYLQNIEGTSNGGTLEGSGKAVLDNLNITDSDFSMNGKLKLLDETSKGASPLAYGEFVIATNGKVELVMSDEEMKLTAPIRVVNMDLTIPPAPSAYSNTSDKFIYVYTGQDGDTSSAGGFESLIRESQERGTQARVESQKSVPLDFNIDVEIENEAKVVYVISKEFNQNLTAVLEGNFNYETVGGRPVSTGELKLLEGSTLEFFKTLTASGSVRFEGDVTNPYLNIVATYRDYYTPAEPAGTNGNESSSGRANEKIVAVKIKVQGRVQELDKNFMQEQNRIAVYYGEENIENDTPDPTKDASDAVMFILIGKFTSDLNATERTETAGTLTGPATSLAGSLLGGFLNRQFGEYVRSVELRRTGSSTSFMLQGRVNEFRYSIGGTTDVFQDLSQANIRIEYPLIESLLLRLERREAINETNISNEMINELGLKYRFEF